MTIDHNERIGAFVRGFFHDCQKRSIPRHHIRWVILHSSCPHLLMHKGRREAIEMLRRVHYKQLKPEDWPWFMLFFRRLLKSYFV